MVANPLIQLSIVRALYGVLALLAPKLLARSVGMTEEQLGSEARYFNRLLGGRDLLVAAGTIAAVRGGTVKQATTANIVCEVTDSISLVEELRARGGVDRIVAIGLVFNVGGYATLLRALRSR
jgi:hypothetical protein